MTEYLIGNWRTGGELRPVKVIEGPWSVGLNSDDSLTAVLSLRDRDVAALDLMNTATAGQSMLIACDGDVIHAGGPIWRHDLDDDSGKLTLTAAGPLSWLNRVLVLPELEGRLPTDPTTDTRFMPVDDDPESDYPWPTDTRTSQQGIIRALIAQVLSRTGADVPFVLPAEIPGESEADIRGIDLAYVGERVRQITQTENGPEVRMRLRFTPDRLGVEVVVQIGTPTEPMIYSPIEPVFNLSAPSSSISGLKVSIDATRLATNGFATGGRRDDTVLLGAATTDVLLDAGFALMEATDSSHSSETISATVQGYAEAVVMRGIRPVQTWQFTHQAKSVPHAGSFDVGDFCKVNVGEHPYLPSGQYRLRVTGISGDARGERIGLSFQPDPFGYTPAPTSDGYGTGYFNPGLFGG